jgi:hypothetical protein
MSDDDEFRRVPEIERAANEKPTYLDTDAAAVGEIGRNLSLGFFLPRHARRGRCGVSLLCLSLALRKGVYCYRKALVEDVGQAACP